MTPEWEAVERDVGALTLSMKAALLKPHEFNRGDAERLQKAIIACAQLLPAFRIAADNAVTANREPK
jgi:hypothetical protein